MIWDTCIWLYIGAKDNLAEKKKLYLSSTYHSFLFIFLSLMLNTGIYSFCSAFDACIAKGVIMKTGVKQNRTSCVSIKSENWRCGFWKILLSFWSTITLLCIHNAAKIIFHLESTKSNQAGVSWEVAYLERRGEGVPWHCLNRLPLIFDSENKCTSTCMTSRQFFYENAW